MPENTQQYEYFTAQPQGETSMAGFYAIIISLFVLFTLAMGGMMWYMASQLKSDRSEDSRSETKERSETVDWDDEKEEPSSRSSSSRDDSKNDSQKSSAGSINIVKKLSQECGACVVLIEGQSKNDHWSATGFIIYKDPEGSSLILTNRHAAFPSDSSDYSLTVKNKSKEVLKAEPVARAKYADLAILSIKNMKNLEPIWRLCSSKWIEEGDEIYTVGDSEGHIDFKISGPGKLSRKNYENELNVNGAVLEHTVEICASNSGGPIFDSEGRIIGINTYVGDHRNNLFQAIPIEYLHKDGLWDCPDDIRSKIRKIPIEGE